MTHDELRKALADVADQQRVADAFIPELVRLVVGRLCASRERFSWSDKELLKRLKRELQDFDSRTGRWRSV